MNGSPSAALPGDEPWWVGQDEVQAAVPYAFLLGLVLTPFLPGEAGRTTIPTWVLRATNPSRLHILSLAEGLAPNGTSSLYMSTCLLFLRVWVAVPSPGTHLGYLFFHTHSPDGHILDASLLCWPVYRRGPLVLGVWAAGGPFPLVCLYGL